MRFHLRSVVVITRPISLEQNRAESHVGRRCPGQLARWTTEAGGTALQGCDESKLCYSEKACVRVKLEGFAGMRITCNIAALIDAAIVETGFWKLSEESCT